MKNTPCKLCGEPIQAKTEELCSRCLEMERQINNLIENHKETAKEYLEKKLTEITGRVDRRVKKHKLGWGTHTPDRREGDRRAMQKPDSLKRRKSDR